MEKILRRYENQMISNRKHTVTYPISGITAYYENIFD